MTERLHFHFSLLCIGEGNGNPLQHSSLENPRDGVAQSWTWLKWLSSSSIQRKSRDQKGELCDASEAQQEKTRVLFFPSKGSAIEKHWTLGLLQPSQLPFLLYKSIHLPLPRGYLPESCQGCRLWNAVLGWSHINSFLLEKLLAAYLFQVNKCMVICGGETHCCGWVLVSASDLIHSCLP